MTPDGREFSLDRPMLGDALWFIEAYWSEFSRPLPAWWGVFDLVVSIRLFFDSGIVARCGESRIGFALVDRDAHGSIIIRRLARHWLKTEVPPISVSYDGRDEVWTKFIEGSWYCCGTLVAPDFRRGGIGTKFAVERLRMAERSGARSVFVACVDGSGTEEIYQGLGFTEVGRTANLVVMALPLAQPTEQDWKPRFSLSERLQFGWLQYPWSYFTIMVAFIVFTSWLVAAK